MDLHDPNRIAFRDCKRFAPLSTIMTLATNLGSTLYLRLLAEIACDASLTGVDSIPGQEFVDGCHLAGLRYRRHEAGLRDSPLI
jgi:hypothetical protein